MAGYESLRHVSIGRYVPTDSPIHRLDPRAKLVAAACLVVASVVANRYVTAVLLLTLAFLLVKLARLSLRYMLGSLLPILPVLLIMALLQLVLYGGASTAGGSSHLLVDWGPLHISATSVRIIAITWARFATLFLLVSLLTSTTTVSALARGVEGLLRPLNAMGVPGHEVAMVGNIGLRFLPILGEQLEAILQAQASRGVDRNARGRWRLAQNARQMANTVVPLFVDAYRRSEEMILAMQARCYRGGKNRTYLVTFAPKATDYIAATSGIVLLAIVVGLQFAHLP
jgi:energy-coupling factor transport system permease protein